MEPILQQLENLDKISRQLEFSRDERTNLLNTVGNYANTFLSGLDNVPTFSEKEPRKSLAIHEKKSLEEILSLYQSEVAETGINAASGGHLGYIPGGGIFSAALADFLAAVTNPYAGVYYASPGAVLIENEVINWLKTIFSFPKSAVGNLASGGSISTLIALTAARDKHQIKNDRIKNSVVYVSEQIHHCFQKTLLIIGLEDIIIRYVPLDDADKMNPDALQEIIKKDIEAGLNPFLVAGTAGTTDTGTVDPLDKIADIAAQNKMWFHVDAAYGGFFILTSRKDLLKGIEKADSLIVDPHKGMFLPYGLGAVLIKDEKAMLHSNHYLANYMQDAEEDGILTNSPANLSPELTKHFRGLRLWLPLQLHGTEPFIATLEEKLLLLQYFRTKLQEIGFNIGPTPDLSISYFWYPFENDSNEKNKQLMEAIHRDGSIFFSSSVIKKQYVIRIAILSFRTKLLHIEKAVEMIKLCLKEIE
ncbi:MAG: aminotransferase class V-fold PLP-dependent enzyme [Ginsengibacter sp.]